MRKPNLVDAKSVLSNDGRKVRVLFYDDGAYRFRVYDCPLVLEEAFLSGNAQQNCIIKLAPKGRNSAELPSSRGTGGEAEAIERLLAAIRHSDDPAVAEAGTQFERELHGALVQLVTQVGNHPEIAAVVPEIQELTGTTDLS